MRNAVRALGNGVATLSRKSIVGGVARAEINFARQFPSPLIMRTSWFDQTRLPGIRFASTLALEEAEDEKAETVIVRPGESDIVYSALYSLDPRANHRGLYTLEEGGTIYSTHKLNGTTLGEKNWFFDFVRSRTSHSYFTGPKNEGSKFNIKYCSSSRTEEFIETLNPEITTNLKLADFPHLWPGYNISLKTKESDARRNRSQAISRFHFLQDIYVKERANDSEDSKRMQMWEYIDLGMDPIKAFQTAFPLGDWRAKAFIKKMAHSTMWEMDITGFDLRQAFTDRSNNFDKDAFDKFINAIPSSVTEKEKNTNFLMCVDYIKHICNYDQREYSIRPLLENSKNNWQKNAGKNDFHDNYRDAGQIDDFLITVAKDIVLPLYLDAFPHKLGANELDQFVEDKLLPITFGVISKITNPIVLLGLAQRWHRNQTVIEAQKPIYKAPKAIKEVYDFDWHPIIDDQKIDGFTFKVITTREGLDKEGREMEHCVGGYYSQCLSGDHIISGKAPSGERFTLKLQTVGNKVRRGQCYGVNNEHISNEVSDAVDDLVKRMNSSEIALNDKRGDASIHEKSISEIVLFNVEDPKARKAVFTAYQDTRTLPRPLLKMSYGEFVATVKEEIDYQNSIKAIVRARMAAIETRLAAIERGR